MQIEFINTFEKLTEFVDQIKKNKIKEIAVDFEGESNLHRYGLHLCLVQISDGSKIYIIDPMPELDVYPLKEIFEDGSITKIMCACDFDVKLLKETKGFGLINICDLHYGAKALGIEKLSLQNITEHFLGIELSKSRKKQKSNWNNRPLKESMIDYAADDVRYLIELKEVIVGMLKINGKWDDFVEKCKTLEELELPKDKPPHLSVKGVGMLNRDQRYIFKNIFYAREFVAQRIDRPVYQVIPNAELLKISRNVPQTEQHWEQLCREHKSIKKYKNMLQKAINKSLKK